MFEAVDGLVAEHAEIEQRLADPGIHADQGLAKRLNQRYAELSAIVRTYDEWRRLCDDIGVAHELAGEDESFAAEAVVLSERRAVAEERLRHLLVPRDAAAVTALYGDDAVLSAPGARAVRGKAAIGDYFVKTIAQFSTT